MCYKRVLRLVPIFNSTGFTDRTKEEFKDTRMKKSLQAREVETTPRERLSSNVIRLTDHLLIWLAVRQIRKLRMRWQQALATACALCFHSSIPLRYSSLVGPRHAASISAAVVMLPQHSGLGARAFRGLYESFSRLLVESVARHIRQEL